MNCKSCGAGLRPDDKFCSACGTRVEPDPTAGDSGEIAAFEGREPEMPVQGTGIDAGETTPEGPGAGTGETGERTAEATGKKTGEKAAEDNFSTMPVTPPVKIADVPAAEAADGGKTAVAVADEDVHTPESPVENGKQKKEKKEKKEKAAKASSGRNVGRILLSILLSLLLFVSLLASSLVTLVRLTVREENLESALRDLSLSSLKVGGYSGDPENSDDASDGALPADTEELADYLYDMAKDAPGWENATRKDIAKAMEEPLVNEFLTQMATDYADVVIRGEDPAGKGLTPENITDFVLDHEKETLDVMRKAGYTGDLRIDREELESSLRDTIGDTFVPENIVTGDYQEYMTIFRIVVSLPVLIGLWVITAALVILLIVVNKHRFSAVLSCVGVPALIIGLLFVAAWCAINLYPPMREGLLSLIPLLLGSDLLIFGASLAGGGLLFVIIKAIVRSVQKKRRA